MNDSWQFTSAAVFDAFLAGVDAVIAALADAEVAAAWTAPSLLEDQAVGSLAGHLARGGVWVVADYLSTGEPQAALTYDSAAAYYVDVMARTTAEDHAAIRRRGADIAAGGPDAVIANARERAEELCGTLVAETPERRLEVIGGAVMRLGDYLATRVVEQVVHLDDLARSVGTSFEIPHVCVDLTLSVGIDIARRQHGPTAAVRALYRSGFADILPVL